MSEHSDVTIVAEVTTNHFGDLNRLRRIVELAADAGADMIKVQRRQVETFYSPDTLAEAYESPFGETFGDYRRAIELDDAGFDYLDAVCAANGVPWFASALDTDSFKYFADRGHELIKVPSTVTHHEDLIDVATASGLDVVISTGMTDGQQVTDLLRRFTESQRIYLLQCVSAYPAPIEDCNIAVVSAYRQLAEQDPRIIPGYSSHDDGAFGSCLAVAAGARMIEKHVKLSSTPWAHFDEVALDLSCGQFHDFVKQVRLARTATGDGRKRISASEHHKYPWTAKTRARA